MTDTKSTAAPLASFATESAGQIYDPIQALRARFSYPPPLRRTFEKGELTAIGLRGLGAYVKGVNKINHAVGHVAMYLLVLMLGILVWSVVSKGLGKPSIWVMEMAQFTMAAYYLLGAGFSMQQGAHVRMDFLYERWKPRRRSLVDSFTSVFLIFYLVMLVIGGWSSSAYALEFGQRNRTVWAPPMAPIKIIMTTGMFLMLLQSTAELAKDICRACGFELVQEKNTAAPQAVADASPAPAPAG
ncbi:TRAP transporter small permease subunit [Termitidicoccus mucosus]|uniref:TRAP transporter small permease subunit n=1 Tax=Termitidicoccus mucosus TaxID=1184151 RepID=UPI0026CC2B3A